MRFGVKHIIGGLYIVGAIVGTAIIISEVFSEEDLSKAGKLTIGGVNEVAQRVLESDFEKTAVDVAAQIANAGIDLIK